MNVSLSSILIYQSKEDLKQQMQERMLDILKSASALLDGDVLATLKAEDYNTEPYQQSLAVLRAFQENFNLDYIYLIRDMGNNNFAFTLDPDPDNPGEFGEPIAYTEGLYTASLGIPSFDKVPYEDRWGRFYSAYNPVFDSKGNVGGIIAVDVDANWYESQLKEYIFTTAIVSAFSLCAGGLIVFLLMVRLRRRFAFLNSEMNQLTDEVEELSEVLRFVSGKKLNNQSKEYTTKYLNDIEQNSKDSLEKLGKKLCVVRKELQQYILQAQDLAYTDSLTGLRNRNAYAEAVSIQNNKIQNSNANFAVAIFDINGLKNANDNFGHEYGDYMITTVSDILKDTVNSANLFRIGGDEFVAILENMTKETLEQMFDEIDKKLAQKNESENQLKDKILVAISKGAALYKNDSFIDFISVFREADEAMYADKAAYYKNHADRRRKRV